MRYIDDSDGEEGDFRETIMLRKNTLLEPEVAEPTFEDFKMLMVLGRGNFGKVLLAELQTDKSLYAIKSLRKDHLI